MISLILSFDNNSSLKTQIQGNMKVKDITGFLNRSIPPQLQESYDNSGLLAGDPEREISRVLITLDVTEEVIHEAVDKDCGLVIAHHPLIFKGLKSLTGKNMVERCVILALKHDIAIYAAHTNLDHLHGGVSFALAEKLGLKESRVLRPMDGVLRKLVTFCPDDHADKVREAIFRAGAGHIGAYDSCSYNTEGFGTFRAGEGADPFVGKIAELHNEKEQRIETIFPHWKQDEVLQAMFKAHPYEEVAYDIYPLENKDPVSGPGAVGELDPPEQLISFLKKIKSICGTGMIRHTDPHSTDVERVALCGGAGSFLIPDAIAAGADVFITADLKYHDFFLAEGRITLVDAGHFETEQFACEILGHMLSENFPNFAVLKSESKTNPVNYL